MKKAEIEYLEIEKNEEFEELINKNMIWVLLRVKYRVIKNIPLYSKVKVTTYPKKKGLVDFDRETQIEDLNGQLNRLTQRLNSNTELVETYNTEIDQIIAELEQLEASMKT